MSKTKELLNDILDKDIIQQDAWWEGDNCCCNYSEMEETWNDHLSSLICSTMQDYALWDEDGPEKGGGLVQNCTGGAS